MRTDSGSAAERRADSSGTDTVGREADGLETCRRENQPDEAAATHHSLISHAHTSETNQGDSERHLHIQRVREFRGIYLVRIHISSHHFSC